ncbi:DUF5412 domain-containing protein [Bacillus cereus group sp. BfR-BA-01380]|uniref:DUF5412 domain-containing protein n=1 Tax=Bacillus cereus group sp. BfR-BA-01380 TaxID=2920324 RepID=UPI001F5AB76A|nr:DUF5412 domain-containing protein [Bacillus cereus group sp. BfR-BA-01380]
MNTKNAQKEIKKTKRKVGIVLLSMLIIGVGFVYWKFFSLQGVPTGELIRTIESPNGEYKIKTYFHDGGSLSADAVRGELVHLKTNSTKTIYWNYPDKDPFVEWLNETTVKIGDQTLHIPKQETYDWRDDKNYTRAYPKQFMK